MRKTAAACACFMLLAVGAKAQEQDPGQVLRVTLDDAIEIALSENLTVQVADQEVTKKGYAKKGSYGQLFPQVDFSANYQRTLKQQTMSMNGQSFKVGTDNTWNMGFNASMPLVSVALWKSLKISAYDVEMAVEQARSSRIDMIDQVKQAYFGVLLAQDSRKVFQEAYDNAVRNYDDINLKYGQGLVAEYDLIRANVNVKNAEPNLYDSESALILAKWQLKVLLGLDLGIDIECVETLADYEKMLAHDYASSTDISLDGNSSLLQMDITMKQLKKTKQMQMAQYYPTLSANFSYNWVSMSDNAAFKNFKWNPYSVAGVTLSVPIFSGGQRYHSVKQAQVSMSQLEKQKLETERNLRLAVQQSSDRMNTSVKQYYAASAGVESAEKGYMITMKRYDTGEGTILEINDSQLQMTQAQLNLNQAVYNYYIAKSALEKTLGNTVE